MKITLNKLKNLETCEDEIDFCKEQKLIGLEAPEFIRRLLALDELLRANSLLAQVLSRKNCIRYACFAALDSLPIYEKRFPDDHRPRLLIEASEACAKSNNEQNRAVITATAMEWRPPWKLDDTSLDDTSVVRSVRAVVCMARAAMASLRYVRWSESADAAEAASVAVWYSADCERAARTSAMNKYLNFGLGLLEEKD